MDPMLVLALHNVEATGKAAARAAKTGDFGTAALEFAQASMVLGMQIGHQRIRLGPRFTGSPESKHIEVVAQRLTTAITLAFAQPAPTVALIGAVEDEEEEPTDDDVEVDEVYLAEEELSEEYE
jgi:hypothetical protein